MGSGMWALICCVATTVGAATGAAAGCNLAIGGDAYRKEILLTDVVDPHGMAVDHATGTLYFNYQWKGNRTSAKLDLRTKAFGHIVELTGWCSFAVDRVRGEVHAGCGDGLHALDSNVGGFVPAGEAGRWVHFVHYHNDTLYYSFYNSYLLHAFRDGRSARVPEVVGEVDGLVVDGHGNWIFRNSTGLYRQRAGAAGAMRYAEVNSPWTLAVDARGAAYACGYAYDTGLYRLHEDAPSATWLLRAGCSGLAVDSDSNIIYGDWAYYRIVRLVKC